MENEVLQGAYSAEEFADAIDSLRVTGLRPGFSIGWKAFEGLYSIPKGQWSVVTGYSSSGKSTWLDNVFVQMASIHNWKFLICSPENQPIERHIASLMEIVIGKKFGQPNEFFPNIPPLAYMTDEEHRQAYAFVCQHFYFIDPPDTDFTVDGIIAIARKVYETFQFDGMILDPYNEIEHKRPKGLNETDYIATVIQRFRDFARQLNIHFWFVAHPTKPVKLSVRYQKSEIDEEAKKPVYQKCALFDIASSANWKSQCDFGVIVHRDWLDQSAPSFIQIEKIRFRENGMASEVPMFYDYLCNRFVEHYDQLLFHRV